MLNNGTTTVAADVARPLTGISAADTPAEIVEALRVEYDVFYEIGFCAESPRGIVDEYRKYMSQSRFHVYRAEGEAMGVLREIRHGAFPPPMFTEFDIDPAYHHLVGDPTVAEVGILAMRPEAQGLGAAEQLYAVSWYDAFRRGIRYWGAVIEEWLFDVFTQQYHFAFRQCGTPRDYMGAMCVPVVMSFAETVHNMRTKDRAVYERFLGGFPADDLRRAEAGPRLAVAS